jgi:hypothetical protein
MKNNLFKITSLNIYENSSNNFLKFEKSSKNSQANARKPQKPVQRKKTRKQNRKTEYQTVQKKYWTRTDGPRAILLRSRAEQTKARHLSMWTHRCTLRW